MVVVVLVVVVVGGGYGGCHFCLLVKKADDAKKKNMYDVGGHERKKMPFLKYPFPSQFSKHNKCSLSNQTNCFTTQREDKC